MKAVTTKSIIARLVIVIGLLSAMPAQAKSIKLTIDASLAEYILETACSGAGIDEDALRAMPLLQSQIKHHSNLTAQRDMDAFIAGLRAASACETAGEDHFLFGPVVEETEKFENAVAYFKERSSEIEAFVAERLLPYMPDDLDYEGELVLSIVGNNCGGFSMDGKFFLALNCLRDVYEDEYQTALLVSAHETYHDIQYEFFYPFEEDVERVKSLDDAFDYLFMNLTLEGTAELAADSRDATGSGLLSGLFKRYSRRAYGQMGYNMRLFSYAGELLKDDGALMRRVKDVYNLGFGGATGQIFYYVGAEMARQIDDVYGRDALICVLALPPEQFVRAYDAAAEAEPNETRPPLGETMRKAAGRLSRNREKQLRFETCAA